MNENLRNNMQKFGRCGQGIPKIKGCIVKCLNLKKQKNNNKSIISECILKKKKKRKPLKSRWSAIRKIRD